MLKTLKVEVLVEKAEKVGEPEVMTEMTMKMTKKKLVSRMSLVEDKVELGKVDQEWSALNV